MAPLPGDRLGGRSSRRLVSPMPEREERSEIGAATDDAHTRTSLIGDGGGYRGGALNLAARLCSIAGPAEILASPTVTHLARKVDGVAYVERGAVRLKGLAEPVHVIRLRAEADDPADDMAFRRALGSS